MKKKSKEMPKSINTKRNNKCNIKFLKELKGQVVVSLEQYLANQDLFLRTPDNNLRLKDNREVIVAITIGDKYFPADKTADILSSYIFAVASGCYSSDKYDAKTNAILPVARALKIYCDIENVLNPSEIQDTLDCLRKVDEDLYNVLRDKHTVKNLDRYCKSKYENPCNPKIQLVNESIDSERLAQFVEYGYKPLLKHLGAKFDSVEESKSFTFSLVAAGIMVTQFRGMGMKEAFDYFKRELYLNDKKFIKYFWSLLTIDKEA